MRFAFCGLTGLAAVAPIIAYWPGLARDLAIASARVMGTSRLPDALAKRAVDFRTGTRGAVPRISWIVGPRVRSSCCDAPNGNVTRVVSLAASS